MLESKNQLSSIESCTIFREFSLFILWIEIEMVENLTSIDKLHDHVETLLILECIFKSHDEWMLESCEYITLSLNSFIIVSHNDQLLLHYFHRIEPFCQLVLHKEHLAKCALSNDFDKKEVFFGL